ncbi:MAG: hypothetical protein JXA90_12785, partial [Planctomycetes bacterium]|nr:hypothetical protein [Planctomycetota bacterium]
LERWEKFGREEQILMIANEMHRAGKLPPGDSERRKRAYERVLRLVDLTVQVQARPAFRRELLRWRDLVAELYLRSEHDPAAHRAALRALLHFTPRSARQAPLILR